MKTVSVILLAGLCMGCTSQPPQTAPGAKAMELRELVSSGRFEEAKVLVGKMDAAEMAQYWRHRLTEAEFADPYGRVTDKLLAEYKEFMDFYQAWMEYAEKQNR